MMSDAYLLLAYLNGADSYTNWNLFYLHSNDMNNGKFILEKKVKL